MKATIYTLMFLAVTASAPAQDPADADKKAARSIRWRESYAKALEESRSTTRPLLIDFEADWCGWCKKLDRETFGNGQVIQLVEKLFVPVRIDTDHEPKLAAKFAVKGLPTILLLSPNEKELQRLSGFRPAAKFLGELRQTIKTTSSLEELEKAVKKNPADLGAIRAWARAVFASGDEDRAETILAAALQKNPGDASILLEIADLKKAGGHPAAARKLYDQVLALGAEKAGDSFRRAHLPLAKILLGKKDYQGAIQTLTTYTGQEKKDPGMAEAFFLRSYAYSVLDRDGEALADLRMVLALDPDGDYGARAAYIIDLVDQKKD